MTEMNGLPSKREEIKKLVGRAIDLDPIAISQIESLRGRAPHDLAFNTTLDRSLNRLSADVQVLHALHRATLSVRSASIAPASESPPQIGGGKTLIALTSCWKALPRPRLKVRTSLWQCVVRRLLPLSGRPSDAIDAPRANCSGG
jgi:hypothetical protein